MRLSLRRDIVPSEAAAEPGATWRVSSYRRGKAEAGGPGGAAIRYYVTEFPMAQSEPIAWLAHIHVHPHYLVIIGILTCSDAVAARKTNKGTNATVVEIIAFRTKMYLSQRICEFRQI